LREGIKEGEFADQSTGIVANCIVGALAEALVGPLAPHHTASLTEQEEAVHSIVNFCLNAVSQ